MGQPLAIIGAVSIGGALDDEVGDSLLGDGGEVPGVDADVDLALLLSPFLVDVAVEQPVSVVVGPPISVFDVVSGVELVRESGRGARCGRRWCGGRGCR